MNNWKQFTFIVIILLTVADGALADGMLLSAPEYYIYENSQIAFLQYASQSRNEKLSILPGFRGDAFEFAWVLPMPATPTITEADPIFFRQLREFTRPQHHYRDGDWDGCNQTYDVANVEFDAGGVTIVESQLVGYYQTMVLEANQSPALIDSLTQWGFLHSGNIDQATDLIDSYVDQGWSFVTVKVDSASFYSTFPQYNDYGYYGGLLAPLTFTFASDELVYPMRISALSAAESTDVDLFILGDHRMDFPGASTRYANRFDADEISSISTQYYSRIKTLLSPGDFLTFLRREYSPSQMNEDITITQASNDEEYWLVYYSKFPWMTAFLLGPAVLWGVYRRFQKRRPQGT